MEDHLQEACNDLALIVTGRRRFDLVRTRDLAEKVPADFLAKAAVLSSELGKGSNAAFLLAALTDRDVTLLSQVFDRVVLSTETLRKYVQYIRSGLFRRRSLGHRPKRLIQDWLNRCPAEILLGEAFYSKPSLAHIVRWAHPRPQDASHQAVYALMSGRPVDASRLPSRRIRPRLSKEPRRLRAENKTSYEVVTSVPL